MMMMMIRPSLLFPAVAVEEVVDLSRPHAEREIAQNAGHDANVFNSAWISMWLAYRFCPSAPHHCLPRGGIRLGNGHAPAMTARPPGSTATRN